MRPKLRLTLWITLIYIWISSGLDNKMFAIESLHNIRVPHTSKAQKESPNVLTSVVGLLV
jgi:hypothetical protein